MQTTHQNVRSMRWKEIGSRLQEALNRCYLNIDSSRRPPDPVSSVTLKGLISVSDNAAHSLNNRSKLDQGRKSTPPHPHLSPP